VIIQVPAQTQVHTQTTTIITGPITVTREFPATILGVYDGGAVAVRVGNQQDIMVRLYGLAAPESHQPGGLEATAALRPLLGRQVTIREMDTDHYGRTAALIEYNGRSVNLDLVAMGHARHYPMYCREQPICGQLRAAEAEARATGKGIWAVAGQ
jgi:endonuclease YncB( thermonuclease family)